MIFLYIFLGLIALLCLLLFLDVGIKLTYHNEFQLTVYILGIPIDAQKTIQKFQKKNNVKEEKPKKQKKKKVTKKLSVLQTIEDVLSFTKAICRAIVCVAKNLKKHLKIRVKSLHLTVASDDAAKTALIYGELSGIFSNLFELCKKHTNFKANYNKFSILSDFESKNFQAEFDILLKMKPIFMLTTFASARLAFMRDLLNLSVPNSKNTPQKQKGTNK